MPLLTPAQAVELSNALVDAFDPTTLPWLVRASLGGKLYAIVNVNQDFVSVVKGLLDWLERQGSATLEAFLRGAVKARPTRQPLHDFCGAHFPKILQSVDDSSLVHSFDLGLRLLLDMRDQPTVRETVGAFRADLLATSQQIVQLKKYKTLHDCLHELQMDLDAIADALNHVHNNPGGVKALRSYAFVLQRLAEDARGQVAGLPTEAEEVNWIEDFSSCASDIEKATVPTATPQDQGWAADVTERLKDLLTNTRRINGLLVTTAAALRLESFAQTMKTIADKIKGFAGPDDNVVKLMDNSTAVALLSARIAGLVAEHNEWQVFNINLDVAEESRKYQPKDRMPKWPQFKNNITSLCDAYPDMAWSRELQQRLLTWMAATSSAQPTEQEQTSAEVALGDFHRACIYRYYDVDKELYRLSDQVITVASPINTLLNAIQ